MAFAGERLRTAVGLAVLGAMSVLLTGCGNFFTCEGKASCPSTGTGSSTTDYAYVSNSASGATTINGYAVSSGTLVAATNSPYQLSYTPQAMVVSANDKYLYVASTSTTGTGYIYGYSIGTGGALTSLNNGTALVAENSAAVDISPDGNWLFSLNLDGLSIEEYSLNTTTGALSFANNFSYSGATGGVVTPAAIKVAPSANFIVCALGTAGIVTFPFTTSTGATGPGNSLYSPVNTSTGIFTVAVDGNNYLYAGGTAGVQVFSTTTAGVPTLISKTAYTAGNAPRAMLVSSGNGYVYTGNQTDGTITEDAIGASGVLTAVTGSPVTGPATVSAMGEDSTGKYIVAAGYSATSGIQIFAIGTSGALTPSGSAASGTTTTVPTAIAMTH